MVRIFLSLLAGVVALAAAGAATVPATALAAPDRGAAAKHPLRSGTTTANSALLRLRPDQLKPGNKLAPIWTFTNGAAGQRNVIDTIPEQAGYSPLWQVNKVTWAAGMDPARFFPDAVRKAAAAGNVTIVATATVVNCPALGFGRERVAGFSGGRVIHYYDLGRVNVAPGNAIVPLYAVTNGVSGQHNITGDTITPGQTAYPPLWAITKVTWEHGVTPRLLTSHAAIEKAVRAEQVTLMKTALVVNCPLV